MKSQLNSFIYNVAIKIFLVLTQLYFSQELCIIDRTDCTVRKELFNILILITG